MPSLRRLTLTTVIERTLCYDDLNLSLCEMYEAVGFSDGRQPDAQTCTEVEHILSEVREWLQPRLAIVTTGMDPLDACSPGPIIKAQLRGSEALCWFVATAGMAFERYQQRLMQEGDMVKVYLANEIGSLLAEKTADCMEEILQQQLTPKGLCRTNRFSPGYCGWNVSEQRKLFALLPPHPCDITLTDSCLMIPIKSVSGIIGIGHNVRKHDYTCGICQLSSCYKRKKKEVLSEDGL